MSEPRIYLDNAATSWPKPEAVYQAVDRYLREGGAAAGRGVYRHAAESNRIVEQARRGVARLIGAEDESRVCFAANGSEALNIAIHGLLRPGDHAICTEAEHNSVLRPLHHTSERGVSLTVVRCDGNGLVDPDEVRQAIRHDTKLVAMLHASNVTGTIEPIEEVGQICRDRGVCFLVDAAQSIGHLAIDVQQMNIDLLAAPGHKGLLGPLGTGLLYVRPGLEDRLFAVRQGGTGSNSHSELQPDVLPDKYEIGNPNVAGLAGLAAALDWLNAKSIVSIRQHELELIERLDGKLRDLPNVNVFGPVDRRESVGVVSIAINDYDPQEVAALLDASFGIQARAGLHCAPRIHQAMGTLASGGTLRLSTGPFTTHDEIDRAIEAIEAIALEASAT